jgi:hypothetical protein
MTRTQWTESFNSVERCNEHALTCSWHRAEGERTLLEACVCMCVCVCICTMTTLGLTVEVPCAELTEECEVKSHSRAHREVFGNETRVKTL